MLSYPASQGAYGTVAQFHDGTRNLAVKKVAGAFAPDQNSAHALMDAKRIIREARAHLVPCQKRGRNSLFRTLHDLPGDLGVA